MTKCANSEDFPTSLRFSKPADDILNHILSLVEEEVIFTAPIKETKQFSLDNGQNYKLTFGLNGNITGLSSVNTQQGYSFKTCYFFKQQVMEPEVGISGIIEWYDLIVQYEVSVTGSTPSNPDTRKIAYALQKSLWTRLFFRLRHVVPVALIAIQN